MKKIIKFLKDNLISFDYEVQEGSRTIIIKSTIGFLLVDLIKLVNKSKANIIYYGKGAYSLEIYKPKYKKKKDENN